jgi:hypothetical protein
VSWSVKGQEPLLWRTGLLYATAQGEDLEAAPFAGSRTGARRAENKSMLKRLIRDLWGKRTEKKALNPEMRNMLVSLDGVYEQGSPIDSRKTTDPTQRVDETRAR